MGAETSVLQGCKLEDPLPTPSQKDWTIHPAQRKDGSRVSVFVHKKQETAETRKEYHLENAARQLKILRHPTILKFFASCENVDGTFLITEQVKPLDLVIDNLTPEEICAGLYNVVEALSFLHERGGASHNNVCMSSIYVSCQDGGWRLGGMEHLCKYEDATVQFLKQSKPLRNSQCIPPEEKEESLTSTAPSYGHARDAYAFGVLAQNMLEYLSDLGEMTDTFEVSIEDFVDPDPTRRPKLGTLMADKLFKNDFLEITNFTKNLTLKSETQKNVLFEGLAPRLHRLPKLLVASRLAPLLLNSFVMAEPMAVNHLFPHLLVPLRDLSKKRHQEFLPDQVNPIIPLELFQRHVIPVLGKVFPSRELHVRKVLLQQFAYYVDLFHEDKLKKVILPQLLLGLKDANDDIVCASLRALADLVPILGAATVVGGERIRYFVEGRPKFPKQQESPLHKSGHVTSVMAVSGVITLPMMEKSPLPPSLPLTKESEVKRSEFISSEVMTSEQNPAVDNGDRSQALRKQEREKQKEERERLKEERERRREEMKRKNEERKRERERKKALQMGKLTLASLAKEHVEEQNSAASSQLHSPTTVPPQVSLLSSLSEENQSPYQVSMSSQATSQASWEDDDSSDSDKPDWSDWEDMDREKEDSNSIHHLATTSQSQTRLDTGTISVYQSRTSSVSKETSDWSTEDGNWNDRESEWLATNNPKTESKKKTSALQLKSSVKKTQEDKKTKMEPQPHLGDKTAKSTSVKTSQKSTTLKSQNKTPQELGKEYDIPDITAVISSEPDFFADMEPMVSFTGGKSSGADKRNDDLTTKEESSKSTSHESTVSKTESISFAVDDITVMDGDDGWGAEDDWDIEDDS